MDNLVKLRNIYIGTPDGATEAEKENFEELFYDSNNKYSELINNNEKFIILGDKGTGKTYLAKYILKKAPKKQSTEMIDSGDFKLCRLSNIDGENENDDKIYALCKWFLLDKISEHLLDKHKFLKYIPFTNIHKLRMFIDGYDSDIFYSTKKIISNDTSEFKAGVNTSLTRNNKNMKSGKNLARKIIKGCVIEREKKEFFALVKEYEKRVFASLKKNDDILLIIDDIDELENQRTDISAGNIIINLIKASKEYNITKRHHYGKMKIILLLRTDIINKLQSKSANLSKIKTSNSVELYWLFDSFQEKYNHPLISMVFHKIRASCSTFVEWDNKKMYYYFFPEAVDGKPVTDFLLDYSFGRPRDIIIFLNHVICQYPEDSYFSAKALKEVRKYYSQDLYDDVLNRASFQNDSEYINQCFKLIASLKKPSFRYQEIEKYYNENFSKYDKLDKLDDVLSFLYELGVIGNLWKNTKNGEFKSEWSYKKDAMDKIMPGKKFTIHYGLRKKLAV